MPKKNLLYKCGFIVFYMAFLVSFITFIVDLVYIKEPAVLVFLNLPEVNTCTENWIKTIQNYLDITIAIITAIIAALLTITITIFVFLKSALDRIIDENRYISDVANIYKTQSSQIMFMLCSISFLGLILSLIWHLFLSLNNAHITCCLLFGLIGLAIMLICNLLLSSIFWRKCIRVEEALQEIITEECNKLKLELKAHPAIKDSSSLALIGDWSQWETNGMDKKALSKYGENLCIKTTPEHFTSLFARLEILLLTGERIDYRKNYCDTDIITVLRERTNILNPNLMVESQDLSNRYYLNINEANREIIEYIKEYEKNVGYERNIIDNNKFFKNTENLYTILNQYRNLLISWDFTTTKPLKQNVDMKKSKENKYSLSRDTETLKLFAQGLYYFFLQILSLYVSAIHISDFSFNGITLSFANFYSSTLEHVSFYSSEFYHTIFARAQLIHVVMDISRFDGIDLYNTKVVDSIINNANFSYVNFEDSQMERVGLSICLFDKCCFNNSEFSSCVLNGSEFHSCKLYHTNFSNSKMHNIIWNEAEIEFCDFQKAEIKNWKWKKNPPILKQCNFSKSTWSQMAIKKGELSDCDFSEAVLSNTEFENTNLSASIFQHCDLAGIQIYDCKIDQSTFEKALLFAANISYSDLSMANLFDASAVNLQLKNCSLADSNCAEADFSKGAFLRINFNAARLYDCSFMRAQLHSCKCDYLLADHMQFTFTNCKNCSFQYSALSESNLTQSNFEFCSFNKSDLTGLNATQAEFKDCCFVNVDFSRTRFMETKFRTTFHPPGIIRNCNFSNCHFENTTFDHIFFESCIFQETIFVNCFLTHGQTACSLTNANFEEISDQNQNNQIYWY